jgi:hypothetical protein
MASQRILDFPYAVGMGDLAIDQGFEKIIGAESPDAVIIG